MEGENDGREAADEAEAVCRVTRRIDGRDTRWLAEEAQRVSGGADLRQAARSASADWLATLAPWDLYATLTYDRRKWYDAETPPKPHVAERHFRRWVDAAGDLTSRPILAVAALEDTKAGWPHWHAMLATGGLDEQAFGLVSSDWFTKHGYAKFYRIRPDAGLPVAKYCTKYLAKENAFVEFAQSKGAAWPGVQTSLNLRRGSSVPR